MTGKSVWVPGRVLEELHKEFDDKVLKEHGFKPTNQQLIEIMFHHWQGKDVIIEWVKERKCWVIKAI